MIVNGFMDPDYFDYRLYSHIIGLGTAGKMGKVEKTDKRRRPINRKISPSNMSKHQLRYRRKKQAEEQLQMDTEQKKQRNIALLKDISRLKYVLSYLERARDNHTMTCSIDSRSRIDLQHSRSLEEVDMSGPYHQNLSDQASSVLCMTDDNIPTYGAPNAGCIQQASGNTDMLLSVPTNSYLIDNNIPSHISQLPAVLPFNESYTGHSDHLHNNFSVFQNPSPAPVNSFGSPMVNSDVDLSYRNSFYPPVVSSGFQAENQSGDISSDHENEASAHVYNPEDFFHFDEQDGAFSSVPPMEDTSSLKVSLRTNMPLCDNTPSFEQSITMNAYIPDTADIQNEFESLCCDLISTGTLSSLVSSYNGLNSEVNQ